MHFGGHWGMKTPTPHSTPCPPPDPAVLGNHLASIPSLHGSLMSTVSCLPLPTSWAWDPSWVNQSPSPKVWISSTVPRGWKKTTCILGATSKKERLSVFLLPECPELPWFLFLPLFWFSAFLFSMQASPYLLQTSPLCLRWVNSLCCLQPKNHGASSDSYLKIF